MKTKKSSKTNTKSRIIFFAITLTYNLLLGLYLKDFLVLSPILLMFYLISALPAMFFVLKIRSTPMRAVVLIVLFFVMAMSIVSSLSCRRLLPMLTFVVTAIEMMYFGIVDTSSGKDKLLTKICVLVLTAFIAVLLFFSYNFVYKPEAPYLSNGRDTLWDTQTEELALTFPICLLYSAAVRIFRAMLLTVCPMIVPRRIIPGIESILMAHGGIWT